MKILFFDTRSLIQKLLMDNYSFVSSNCCGSAKDITNIFYMHEFNFVCVHLLVLFAIEICKFKSGFENGVIFLLNLFPLELSNYNYLFCNIFLLIVIFLIASFHDNIPHSHFSGLKFQVKFIYYIYLKRKKSSFERYKNRTNQRKLRRKLIVWNLKPAFFGHTVLSFKAKY